METALTTAENTKLENTVVQYIVVDIGNERYGIDIKYVDNIVRMQKITRVPKAQDYFIGVINIRGEVLPVMSVRRRFKIDDDVITGKTRIIILKNDQGMVGILVDAVREVITFGEDELEKNSTDNANDKVYVGMVGKHGDQLVSILSISALLTEKEPS